MTMFGVFSGVIDLHVGVDCCHQNLEVHVFLFSTAGTDIALPHEISVALHMKKVIVN